MLEFFMIKREFPANLADYEDTAVVEPVEPTSLFTLKYFLP